MTKEKPGGAPKPSNKRKTTSEKAAKTSNNIISAAKPDANERVDREEDSPCVWGKKFSGGCVEQFRGPLAFCYGAVACNNTMHLGCYIEALKITTNYTPLEVLGIDKSLLSSTDSKDFHWLRCHEHCNHYKEWRRNVDEGEMGTKQPETYVQASAYHSRADSSSDEDDRKQPAKKKSGDDYLSDDGGGKQPSRKKWNCVNEDLMPYDGSRSNSEEGSCSSMDSSNDDTSDDDNDDDDNDDDDHGGDDDDGNNKGQGALTATTTKNKAARVGNGTAAAERMGATATTETAAAAAAGATTSIEDAAAAFARRKFTVDGIELQAEDKKKIVGDVVCRLLRDHPNPDGENQSIDTKDYPQMFDGWVNPAWWEIVFETWQGLYAMLDGKNKIKANVGGPFSELACKLGCIFHTELCEDETCDLCDRSLPPRLPFDGMVRSV